ncbi:hypothetical protein GVAV_001059 [Gurleya vavrai]
MPNLDAHWHTDPKKLYSISQFTLGSSVNLNNCKCKVLNKSISLTPLLQPHKLNELLNIVFGKNKNRSIIDISETKYINIINKINNYFGIYKKNFLDNKLFLNFNMCFDTNFFLKILDENILCDEIKQVLAIVIEDIIEKLFLIEKNYCSDTNKNSIIDIVFELMLDNFASTLYCVTTIEKFCQKIKNTFSQHYLNKNLLTKNTNIVFMMFCDVFKDIFVCFLFAQDVICRKEYPYHHKSGKPYPLCDNCEKYIKFWLKKFGVVYSKYPTSFCNFNLYLNFDKTDEKTYHLSNVINFCNLNDTKFVLLDILAYFMVHEKYFINGKINNLFENDQLFIEIYYDDIILEILNLLDHKIKNKTELKEYFDQNFQAKKFIDLCIRLKPFEFNIGFLQVFLLKNTESDIAEKLKLYFDDFNSKFFRKKDIILYVKSLIINMENSIENNVGKLISGINCEFKVLISQNNEQISDTITDREKLNTIDFNKTNNFRFFLPCFFKSMFYKFDFSCLKENNYSSLFENFKNLKKYKLNDQNNFNLCNSNLQNKYDKCTNEFQKEFNNESKNEYKINDINVQVPDNYYLDEKKQDTFLIGTKKIKTKINNVPISDTEVNSIKLINFLKKKYAEVKGCEVFHD